jgi:hypothetical protein
VSNYAGAVATAPVLLTMVTSQITEQPNSQALIVGESAYFRVVVQEESPCSYQWRLNGNDLPGMTNQSLTLTNVQFQQTGTYSVVVSNVITCMTSAPAALTVGALRFVEQPASQTGIFGAPSTFNTLVESPLPVTYQWYFNGLLIPGATNRTLPVPATLPGSDGVYTVVASNALGSLASWPATLLIGNLLSWGNPEHTNAPLVFSNVVGIAAGGYHGLALRADGTAVGWGSNDSKQADVPEGLSNIVALAAGYHHSLALRADGIVVAWGNNGLGQTNVPPDLSNVVAIAAGSLHSLALKADKTVVAWGWNSFGQTNVPPGLSNVVGISAGFFHSLALLADGTVCAWGSNREEVTNAPPDLGNVIAIASGDYHNLALKADGTITAWGSNSSNQTNTPPGLSNVISIAAGNYCSLALKSDGTMVVWGSTTSGQTEAPPELRHVIAIAGGYDLNWALVGSAPAAPHLLPLSDTNGLIRIAFPTLRGNRYRLEGTPSLSPPAWQAIPLPPVPGDDTTKTLIDPDVTGPQKFYRVRRIN